MKQITIKEFGEIIETTMRAGLKQSILGIGAPGIGKSEIMQQIADRNGYRLVDLRLAQLQDVDVRGLMYPSADRSYVEWLRPDWFPTGKEGKPTLLLLDEITSASKMVQVAAYQLVLDRRLGQHVLPDDCFIVALGNGADDGGVYIELAAPLANRFEIYEIKVDVPAWLDWATKFIDPETGLGINPMVVSFISNFPANLHTQKQDIDEMVFASPRSWRRVSDTLNALGVNHPIAKMKAVATLGTELGSQFIQHCDKYENLTIVDDILRGVPTDVPKSRSDQLYCIAALQQRYVQISNMGNTEATKQIFKNISKWASGLQEDFNTMLLTNLSSTDTEVTSELLNSEDGQDVIKELEERNIEQQAIEDALMSGQSVTEAKANIASGFGKEEEEGVTIEESDAFFF